MLNSRAVRDTHPPVLEVLPSVRRWERIRVPLAMVAVVLLLAVVALLVVGAIRQSQLQADLALTPEQRVREAERTAREAELVARRRPVNQVLTFDRYEDYLEWKRLRDTGR